MSRVRLLISPYLILSVADVRLEGGEVDIGGSKVEEVKSKSAKDAVSLRKGVNY